MLLVLSLRGFLTEYTNKNDAIRQERSLRGFLTENTNKNDDRRQERSLRELLTEYTNKNDDRRQERSLRGFLTENTNKNEDRKEERSLRGLFTEKKNNSYDRRQERSLSGFLTVNTNKKEDQKQERSLRGFLTENTNKNGDRKEESSLRGLFTENANKKDDSREERSLRGLRHNELLNRLMQLEIEKTLVQQESGGDQDPLLSLLMRAVQDELDKNNLSPPGYRQNPLLRQLLQRTGMRTQEEADRNQLILPKQHQDPLLNQLRTDVMDAFISQFLKLPSRRQDSLLKVLQGPVSGRDRIANISPPKSAQNPLLRQLLSSSRVNQKDNEFGDILSTPDYAQDPLLRQLTNAPKNSDFNFLQTPIEPISFQKLLVSMGGGLAKESMTSTSSISSQQPLIQETDVDSLDDIDISDAILDSSGNLCVVKEDTVETIDSDPKLECTQKNEEECHVTYLTYFKHDQEEKCDETFTKKCHIIFRKQAKKDNLTRCHKPLRKTCTNQGAETCKTEFETVCMSENIGGELTPGLRNTTCERLPVQVCGRGCSVEEGAEVCETREVSSLSDVPEELCDISPQTSCQHVTKLVPSLRPTEQCNQVPRQICSLNVERRRVVRRPLRTQWCLEQEEQR